MSLNAGPPKLTPAIQASTLAVEMHTTGKTHLYYSPSGSVACKPSFDNNTNSFCHININKHPLKMELRPCPRICNHVPH